MKKIAPQIKQINQNLNIFDYFGVEKIPIETIVTRESLLSHMVDLWIPYYECHKCGKWDYCKYAQKHPANPERSIDIKCGITIDFLTNFINSTFDLIAELPYNQIQSYLDTAFYLTQYVMNSEQLVGSFIDADYQEYLGSYAPMLFGQTKRIRNLLDKAHAEMKNISIFSSIQSILLVEGNSEKIFLDEMKKTHLIDFLYLEVEHYGGMGRIQYDKTEHYLNTFKEKGFRIYLQADNDGKGINQNITKIVNKNLVENDNVFTFKYDFETAIPKKLLYMALKELYADIPSLSNFFKTYQNNESIVKFIKRVHNIEISKTLVAKKIAELLIRYENKIRWWQDDNFLATELGQFMSFIRNIRM